MRALLEEIVNGRRLSVEESRTVMHEILHEPVNEPQVAALLMAFRLRGISVDELDGFASALSDLALNADLSEMEVVDVCGTGGDQKGTFNISTTVAFVLAGAGYRVAKHGNYAVSSACGSSDVLERLGIRFTNDRDVLRRTLERAGVCFLHAPLFHPALKRVAHVRRMLGIRTVFNVLGPLINPARPIFQMNGVYDLELMRVYSYLLSRRGTQFGIVYSFDGYDEISLTGTARVVCNRGSRDVSPHHFGLEQLQAQDLLAGNSASDSAALIVSILSGAGTYAQESVVIANSALAMWCRQSSLTIEECVVRARESIKSGAAKRALRASIDE